MYYSHSALLAMKEEATLAAQDAANTFFHETMQGVDGGSCGFSWVVIRDDEGKSIRGNTKLGKALKAAGINKAWDKNYQIWNPSRFPCQNIDTLEAGSRAAAEVFCKYGFKAYASSRLD
jgi:hypothetical protein